MNPHNAMKPNQPANIPIRVKAYNKQLKTDDAKIYLKPGTDPNEATNYTTQLLEQYVEQGCVVLHQNGQYELLYNRASDWPIVKALNYLQLLVYLQYHEDWKKAEAAKNAEITRKAKEAAALAEKQAKEKTKNKDVTIEFEEENGVTKIKGTNFVISKIL